MLKLRHHDRLPYHPNCCQLSSMFSSIIAAGGTTDDVDDSGIDGTDETEDG